MVCNEIFFIDGLGWVTKTGPMAMSELRIVGYRRTAILPPQKLWDAWCSLNTPIFAASRDCLSGRSSPSSSLAMHHWLRCSHP